MLLDARLTVGYAQRGPVLRDLHVELQAGEIHGLAGESGSGKSTLALALMRLLDPSRARVSGSVVFEGTDLLTLSPAAMRSVRGREISLVMQSPIQSLNPRLRIGTQLNEAWRVHERRTPGTPCVRQTLRDVNLPSDDAFLRAYPRELSVGMAQRVLIAMAVLHRPKLIIADEATSALDLITQSEVLGLFRRLNEMHGTAILFITHDLAAAAALCHRIAVLREGTIVESGPTADVFQRPANDYTRKLVSALPRVENPPRPAPVV